jgi:hypothetical protein
VITALRAGNSDATFYGMQYVVASGLPGASSSSQRWQLRSVSKRAATVQPWPWALQRT